LAISFLLDLIIVFESLFRFHKTHRNADHAPDNVRLARIEINSYDPDADLFDFCAIYVAPRERT
jgi:hypothetical protein